MSLPLPKDVRVLAAPSWWPPAPGWWVVLGVVLLLALAVFWWLRSRKRRHERVIRLFDIEVDAAHSPAAQVAAMSGLLRRAARRKDAAADRLQGEDWLQFLDSGMEPPVFVDGVGRLLLEGGFRADVDPQAVQALRTVARQRYLDWMRGG